MFTEWRGFLAGAVAAGALLGLGGCTTDDLNAFAEGMAMAADELSVTMTMVPAFGCDYNTNGYLVCDDTGDGYADRYGDPAYDGLAYTAYGNGYYSTPAPRVNGYGEAYVFDSDCACWVREPSLDELPEDRRRHRRHDRDD